MAKILVVGSLNMDIVVSAPRAPERGETVLGTHLEYIPGGKGANQAVAAGRLGGDTAMIGCVGKDSFGESLLENLKDADVDYSCVDRTSETTGTALITVEKTGANRIVVVPGANSLCNADYLRKLSSKIEQYDILMVQMEIPAEAVWWLIRDFKKAGRTVILNPAPAPSSVPGDIYSFIDWITPNETELALLSGIATDDMDGIEKAAAELRSRGVGHVLVTVGSKGALLADDQGIRLIPTAKVNAVDTTAAGDCFNGAFAVGLAEGRSAEESIAFANRAASLSVTRKGAQSSLPYRRELC